MIFKNYNMIEVPNKEFQLFFKKYPEKTFPILEDSIQVNEAYFYTFSYHNLRNEIVGVFKGCNCWERESRYFIWADLKKYVNDKENFGTYHYNEYWHYGFGYWQCPKCGYTNKLEIPPKLCPHCYCELKYNKDTNVNYY